MSEPRRYDTRFFVAALPAGQQARDVSGEADRVCWMRPADAVTATDDGRLAMLPPTYLTLRQLSRFSGVDAVTAAATTREMVTVLPEVRLEGEQAVLVLPDQAGQ